MTAEATAGGALVSVGRPSPPVMIWRSLRHANRSFWRSPIAAFFTIVFPLLFLVLLGSLIGNAVIPGTGGVRVAQFLTPAIAAFAATTAAFTALSISVAIERDEGILKRERSTPLAPWMFMVARVGSITWIALLSVVLMVGVGVASFGVTIVWRALPVALLTVLVGVGCWAALGLALVAVVPTPSAVRSVSNAIILPLAFVSGIFAVGPLPPLLELIGWFFPLKHFVTALADAFDPFATTVLVPWDHLAVMAAWGVAGTLVALRWFRWDPVPQTGRRGRRRGTPGTDLDEAPATRMPARLRPVASGPRPGVGRLIVDQARYATRAFWRTSASAFFIVGFPVILLLLLPVVFGNGPVDSRGGVPLTQFLAPVLAVYGAATAAYADFAQRVARLRDDGVLKRIHGTPLPLWAFLAGRILSAIVIAFATLAITVAVGMVVYGVELVPRALPGLLASVAMGVACFAALGLALAALARNARSVPAIANATLLPLAFFSDIFIVGDVPRWMDIVGAIFPLKHFANAVADGVNPTMPGAGLFPVHLAVMGVWLAIGLAVALRWWTWEPRAS